MQKITRKKFTIMSAIFLIVSISLFFAFNYKNWFLSETIKKVEFHLNEEYLSSQNIEIINNNIKLPYPKEIGISPRVGEMFIGYDLNSDGVVDAVAGDEIEVNRSRNVLSIAAVIISDTIPFTAWLYDDSDYISGTELTSVGSITTNWDYTKPVRYLVIQPNFTEATGGTVEITLPIGMQWYDTDTNISTTTWTPASGVITDATFTTLTGLTGEGAQGAGIYKNLRTGTLTYTYSSLATNEDPIVIPITFDYQIWNKANMTDNNLTGTNDSVTVTMKENNNTYVKKINEVEFSNNKPRVIDIYYAVKNFSAGGDVDTWIAGTSDLTGYYEKIEVEFLLPTDGEGNYATYVKEDVNTYFSNPDYAEKWEIDKSDPSKIVFTAYDINITRWLYISPIVNFAADLFEVGEKVEYGFTLRTEAYGGDVYENTRMIEAVIIDPVVIKPYSYGKTVYVDEPDDIEQSLGYLSFYNDGLSNSGAYTVKYVFDDRNEINSNIRNNIDVTNVFLPQNVKTTYDINYVLIDKYNNEVARETYENFLSGNSISRNLGYDVSIKMLTDDYNSKNPDDLLNFEEVSIKEISYQIDYILANSKYYQIGAPMYVGCTGTFYGQHNTSELAYSTLTLTNVNTLETEISTYNIVRPTQNKDTRLYIDSIVNKKSEVQAGEEIEISARVNQHPYPYTYSQYTENPELYLILPEGITLNEEKLTAVHKGETIIPNIRHEIDESNNNNVYILSFDQGEVGVGGPFFNENYILQVANLNHIVFNLTLKTDPAYDLTIIDIASCLYTGVPFVTNNQGQVVEPYDFDGDGKLNRIISKPALGTKSFTIMPNTNVFEFSNEIKIGDKEYTSSNYSYVTSDEYGSINNGVSSFRLKITNDSDGLIAGEDFYHYIPVPKTGITYPNEMFVENDLFDFSLMNEPLVLGDNGDIYNIYYTTETVLTDSEGNINVPNDAWLSASEITDFSKVTMIAIFGIDNSILRSHTEDIIELQLSYEIKEGYTNTGYDSGKVISFNSYGWQKYLEGGIENTENVYTIVNDVNVLLRSIEKFEEDILVTYKETNEDEVIFEFPAYFENKDIYILDIKEYNMNLVADSTINNSVTNSYITDNNFSLNVSKNGTNYDLSTYNNEPIYLGNTVKDANSNITFKINGYDSMLDVTSSKYIEVYLGDDLGIKYKLVLNIIRESIHNVELNNAVSAGSYYKIINENTNEINIVNGSSYTAQFSLNYDTLLEKDMRLTSTFKMGTIVKMIDISNLTIDENNNYNFTPDYYYYKVAEEKEAILLTDFLSNKDNSSYVSKEGISNYIFIIENNILGTGSYELSLDKVNISNSTVVKSEIFDINISSEREVYIHENNTSYIIKDGKMDVSMDLSSVVGAGVDTKFENNVLGLKITFDGEIPNDAYVEIGDLVYLLEDSENILNVDNYFLIPLGNISNISNVEYTLHIADEKIISNSIKHSIVKLDEPTGEVYASISSNLEDHDYQNPAMLISFDNENQLININDLSSLNLTLNYIDYDPETNFTTRLYIMEKTNDIYLRSSDMIENANINGEVTKPLQDVIVFNPDDDLTSININLNLNDLKYVINGTYRIVVETNHLGEIKYQDILNFIVVD